MKIQFIKSARRKNEYPEQKLPRIAFSGRSNVGKSSLINSLVGRRDAARTSATPGRTQVINFFNVEDRWIFVDLPGYGFAKVPENVRRGWGPMVEEFLREDMDLKLAVVVVDARREPTQLDLLMQQWLEREGVPYQIVATKVDKLSNNRLKTTLDNNRKVFKHGVIPYSAATGVGKKELWRIFERITSYG